MRTMLISAAVFGFLMMVVACEKTDSSFDAPVKNENATTTYKPVIRGSVLERSEQTVVERKEQKKGLQESVSDYGEKVSEVFNVLAQPVTGDNEESGQILDVDLSGQAVKDATRNP